MRLNLGTLALGATLLVNAGEVQAGQKGRTPLAALQQEELEQVKAVIMNSMLSDQYTPQHESNALTRGYGTYHNPASGAFYVYSKETFQAVDSMASLGVIFKSTQDSSPDAICFSAITFVDEFTRDGQRFLVLDEASITNSQVACPEDNKEAAVLEYKPQSGKFADLEPERIKEGLFWAPMLVVKAGEDVPDELTTTNYITSTQAGGRQTVYKKYTLKDYSPETGVLELIDPADEKKCMQTRVFKDRIIGVPTRYILSEPGTPEMQEVLCEEQATVPAPSVPAPSVQDIRPKPGLRAALLAGLEIDEVVDRPGFGPSAEVAAMFTVKPFPNSRFSVGAMGDLIFSPSGSGFEGANVVVGSQGDLLGIYGLVGVASEPRWSREDDPTTPEIERDPFDGVFAAGALVTVDMPFKGPLGATCGVSAELIWGGGDFPLNPGILCGGTFDFHVQRGERPAHSTATLDSVSEEKLTLVKKTEAYVPTGYDLDGYRGKLSLEAREGEATRLSGEMNALAKNNKWSGVEAAYDNMLKLKVKLTFRDYKNGAEAARALGDLRACYERALLALPLAKEGPDQSLLTDWVKDYERTYASVEIVLDGHGEIPALVVENPFDPAKIRALDDLRAAWAKGENYEGFLPAIPYDDPLQKVIYHVGDQSFTLEPLGPRPEEGQASQQATIVIELEQ